MSNWSSTLTSTLAPVTSVNSQTGAVSLNAASIGAAATSHTHAASDINSGTIATARLGSGTANSTTYLRGDQTWATVSAGDVSFTTAVQDIENTNIRRNILQFTVPPNTWADGEIIWIEWWYRIYNVTGTSQNLTLDWANGGSQIAGPYNKTVPNNTNAYEFVRTYFWRDNDNGVLFRFQPPIYGVSALQYLPAIIPSWQSLDIAANWSGGISSGPNYAGTNQFQLRANWDVANPLLFLRMYNARVYKPAGQTA